MIIVAARHIPGYNYCGPGTEDFTVDPVNDLDAACRDHDLAYKRYTTSKLQRTQADLTLYMKARSLRSRYPVAASLVQAAMLTAPGLWYRG